MAFRLATSRLGLLTASMLTALVAATLLITTSVLSPAVAEQTFRGTVAAVPPADYDLRASTAFNTDTWAEIDDNVRSVVQRHDEIAGELTAAIWTTASRSGDAESEGGDRIAFGAVDQVDTHAELLDGRWPDPDATPIEAIVHSDALSRLGLEVGDSLSIDLFAGATDTADVIVVGAAHRPGTAPRTMRNVKGAVRGYDVRTGKRLWIFDTIPRPGQFGYDSWLEGSAEYNGNTGVWAQMSADPELGLVYVPVEMPTGDYYGGNRPGNNLFADSLVALDVKTGKTRWKTARRQPADQAYTTPLVIRAGGGRAGESFAVEGDRMSIGRTPDAAVFLDDVTVSRNHALLVRRQDGFYIDDLGSLNGTYVNRRRIESHQLEDGDEIQIGKYKLSYLER